MKRHAQSGGPSGKPFIAASATATAAARRILRVKSEEKAADGVRGTFEDPSGSSGSCDPSTTCFKCRYTQQGDSSIYMTTTGTFVDRSTVNCPLPDWGLQHAAATVVFSLYQGSDLVEAFGAALTMYLGETIFTVRPGVGLSGGSDVIISGAGFHTSPNRYYCVLFPTSGVSQYNAQSRKLYPSFPINGTMTAENTTMGRCHVSWPYAATNATYISLVHASTPVTSVYSALSAADRAAAAPQQPIIDSIHLNSGNVFTFTALPFQMQEEWYVPFSPRAGAGLQTIWTPQATCGVLALAPVFVGCRHCPRVWTEYLCVHVRT